MANILSIEQISAALKDRRLLFVANVCGVSYPTIKKLADGEQRNYNTNTLKAVSDYITGDI